MRSSLRNVLSSGAIEVKFAPPVRDPTSLYAAAALPLFLEWGYSADFLSLLLFVDVTADALPYVPAQHRYCTTLESQLHISRSLMWRA